MWWYGEGFVLLVGEIGQQPIKFTIPHCLWSVWTLRGALGALEFGLFFYVYMWPALSSL